MAFLKKHRLLISFLILAVGIICIILGVFRGEAETVFNKASRICLECIGIG